MTPGKKSTGRALMISHVTPDPQGVGLFRRAWRWVAELAAQYDTVDILILSKPPQSPFPIPLPGNVRFLYCNETPALSRDLADWFEPNAALARILSSLPGPEPDRILVFRFYLHDIAALLPSAWREKAEIDCDDWEAGTRGSLAALALRRGRFCLARSRLAEAVKYARLERKVLCTYKTVHVSAGEDVVRMRRWTGCRSLTVSPNKIAPVPGLAPTPPSPGNRTLLFVGALFYPPNDDAMRWFGKSILPYLRCLAPEVRVVAAGRAEESLQRRLARDGIEYVHAPSDLAPIYADAAVVIAPLRGGGGSKLKVLEAWLHERPLVATPHAVRGIAAKAEQHLVVADGARNFARACAALLADRERAARLVHNGRELLRAHYLSGELG